MLKIIAISIGTGLLFFCIAWLKRNLSTAQKPKDKRMQSDTPETLVDAALNAVLINLPVDIDTDSAAEATTDVVVEEGAQGVIGAVFESVGSLFDGL